MLTRLYVDNYKCLVNFDLRLGREHLLLGRNGTGKSTVFEVLSALRSLVQGASVSSAFPTSTLTRWQSHRYQTFELEVDLGGEDARYQYKLVLHHDADARDSFVRDESLFLGGSRLLTTTLDDDEGVFNVTFHTARGPQQWLANLGQSALWALPQGAAFQKVTRFKQWLRNLLVVRIDPRRMAGRSEEEETSPDENLSNLASWYRHLAQERLNEVVEIRDSLRQIFDGFDSLVLKSGGEQVRILRSSWKRKDGMPGTTVIDEYAFEELSDGQRALIGLYTLLHAYENTGATLCLDEPDNFVALREIQPFLLELRARERIQSLVISHHPEVINLLAPDAGLRFERVAGGPVRVSPFQVESEEKATLTPAELVARGWEDGQ
ncbi:AAA family ATPase [Pyxidicoccus sp. 3LG]